MALTAKSFRAPSGTDILNIGTEAFTTDKDGIIELPDDLAAQMTPNAGFERIEAPVILPSGTAEVVGEPNTAFSWGGQSYSSDAAGLACVPVGAVADLAAHGFVVKRVAAAAITEAERFEGDVPAGFAVLCTDPGAGCSWGGTSFTANDKGHIVVPVAAIDSLAAHGLTLAPARAEPEPEPIITTEGSAITDAAGETITTTETAAA